MKASQLRAASDLIDKLDAIRNDIEVFAKTNTEKDFTHVSMHAGQTKLKFKPLRSQYLEFLEQRREVVIVLLKKLGIEVD